MSVLIPRQGAATNIPCQEPDMRKTIFWFGWAVLIALPLIYGAQIILSQDLPSLQLWQWPIPFVAALLIYVSRNRDDVLKHHLV
jgi:hypothetical protein